MSKNHKACIIATLWAMTSACAEHARADTIVVQAHVASPVVNIGDQITLELLAQIPSTCPIVGWGMDVLYDPSFLTADAPATVGSLFAPLPVVGDGDGLGGLVIPPNAPVFGSDVLLATLTFTAHSAGVSQVIGSYTPSDPLEGFVMVGGEFAEIHFEGGVVTVIPAPSVLMSVAMSMLLRGNRRSRQAQC